jgi:hypothetical protein
LILRSIAKRNLDRAIALHKQEELIYRELNAPEGLAMSLANRAGLLAQHLGRPREALPLAEEACRLATAHGLTALAEPAKRILDFVRSKLGG